MKERFYGVWSLSSCVRRYQDGRVDYPFGKNPIGRLYYDRANRMSAQAMRQGRQSATEPTGFVSYFGKFTVDEASHRVVHQVEASLQPAWVGADLVRNYRFDGGGRLVLTRVEGDETDELIWVRQFDS